MNAFPIEPLGDLLFVRREDDYIGMLDRVDLEDRQQKSLHGTVIAAGPGRPLPDGGAAPMTVKVGDRVIFGPAIGIESEFVGGHLLVMKDADVDGVLE